MTSSSTLTVAGPMSNVWPFHVTMLPIALAEYVLPPPLTTVCKFVLIPMALKAGLRSRWRRPG